MPARRWSYSSIDTHPVCERKLVLEDDHRFTFDEDEHTYEYAVGFQVVGRWEELGAGTVLLHVEDVTVGPAPDPWQRGQRVEARLDGAGIVVDGTRLTP